LTVPPTGKYIFTGHDSQTSSDDPTITCLDVTQGGKQVWQKTQHLAVFGSAGDDMFALAGGFVIVGGDKLTAFDPATGNIAWAKPIGSAELGSELCDAPFTDGSGRVYVTASGYLVAVDAKNGHLLWQASLPNNGLFSISLHTAADGNVYVADSKNSLYAVDATNGKCKWVYTNGLLAGQSPITLTAGGGKVYYTAGQAVMAFNADGK